MRENVYPFLKRPLNIYIFIYQPIFISIAYTFRSPNFTTKSKSEKESISWVNIIEPFLGHITLKSILLQYNI